MYAFICILVCIFLDSKREDKILVAGSPQFNLLLISSHLQFWFIGVSQLVQLRDIFKGFISCLIIVISPQFCSRDMNMHMCVHVFLSVYF